jgi:hypothetical protein
MGRMPPPTGRTPAGPLLLISPHIDDVMFSCFGLLCRAESIDVLTVFAGIPAPANAGPWDVKTGFSDARSSIEVRRAEDAAAFHGLPHGRRFLPLLEWQYAPGPRGDSDRSQLLEAVRPWVHDHPGGTLALPAGAGRRPSRVTRPLAAAGLGPPALPVHPDHVYVLDTLLLDLAERRDLRFLLYEELPYAWCGRADRRVGHIAARLGRDAEAFVLAVSPDEKARRVSAYKSQVPHLMYKDRRLDNPASLPPNEIYWALTEPEAASLSR